MERHCSVLSFDICCENENSQRKIEIIRYLGNSKPPRMKKKRIAFLFLIFFTTFLQAQKTSTVSGRHTFSIHYGVSSEKISENFVSVNPATYQPNYNYPHVDYPEGYGMGYWYYSTWLENVDTKNWSQEIKLQYGFTFEKVLLSAGINLSFWNLSMHGGNSSSKSYFKMPDPFQEQVNETSHIFDYSDQSIYMQVPLGIGVHLFQPSKSFNITPILRFNPEIQVSRKVTENEIRHHYYFHSDTFDLAGTHYDGYHLDTTIVNRADDPMLFNPETDDQIFFLNPSISVLIGYRFYKHFGFQLEIGYKSTSKSRIVYGTYYQVNKSPYAHFGLTYTL